MIYCIITKKNNSYYYNSKSIISINMSSNGKGKKNIGKGGNPKLYVTAFYGGDVVKNSTVRLVVSEEHPQLTIAEFSKIYGSDIKANYYQTFNNINNVNESFDNGELNEKLVEGTAGQPIYKISIKDLKVHMKSACADDDDKVTQCKTINVYNKAKKGDDDAGADKKASSKKNLKKKQVLILMSILMPILMLILMKMKMKMKMQRKLQKKLQKLRKPRQKNLRKPKQKKLRKPKQKKLRKPKQKKLRKQRQKKRLQNPRKIRKLQKPKQKKLKKDLIVTALMMTQLKQRTQPKLISVMIPNLNLIMRKKTNRFSCEI